MSRKYLALLMLAIAVGVFVLMPKAPESQAPKVEDDTAVLVDSTDEAWLAIEGESPFDAMPDLTGPSALVDAAIKELNPSASEYFHSDYITYLELVNGDIGKVAADAVIESDAESIRDLLLQHHKITGATDALDFEVQAIRKRRSGITAVYRQKIDGIPVDITSRIKFDDEGNVSRLNSFVVDPASIVVSPSVQKDEAVVHAINALSNEVERALFDVVFEPTANIGTGYPQPTLWYGFENQDSAPHPYWIISLSSSGGRYDYKAVVNAYTGETRVFDSLRR